MAICFKCSKPYPDERKVLGYSVCLVCGDELAHERKHTIACNNKQGYELITDVSFLKQLNPKRTT
jgi:predicted amidophosphoribosyltransferase